MTDRASANNTTASATEEQQHRELMDFLTNNSQMRETARNALKQALWSGGAAVAGGMLLGPIGGLVGGIAGSVVGFMQSNPYDGIVQHLGQLPVEHRGKLVQSVGKVLVDAGASPAELSAPGAFQAKLRDLASRGPVREHIWRACMDVMNEEGAHEANLTSS